MKKLLSLLTLLVVAISASWAEDISISPTLGQNVSSLPYGLFTISHSSTASSSGSKISSSAITTGTNGDVITINFQTSKSDMYIKSVTFSNLSNGTLDSDDGTISDNVLSVTGNNNNVDVVLTSASTKKGSVKISSVVVNTGSNDVETISFSSVSSGTVSFTSTKNGESVTSAISSITSNGNATVSSGILSWPNSKTLVFTSSNNIKYLAFLSGDDKLSATASPDTYANAVWTGTSKTITFTNNAGGGRTVKKVYVITEASGPVDPTFSLSKTSIGTDETAKILLGGEDTFGDNFTAGTLWESASGGPYITLGVDGTITPIKATPAGYYFTFTATAKDATKYNTVTGNQIDITVTNPTCVAPEITPATFTTDNQEVTMSTETTGATIYYTTDGTDPTTESSAYDGENKPTVSSTTTFKAIAVKDGYDNSTITTQKVARTASALVGDWDFTNWSSATITGTGGDTDKWYDHEKSDGSGVDFTEGKGAVNKAALNTEVIKFGTTEIEEAKNLKFKADAYQMALVYNVPTALSTYHGSQYIWLFKSSSSITIPSLSAGATVEIGFESHKLDGTSDATRTLTVTNTDEGSYATEAYTEQTFTVTADGDVKISPSKGMHVYYIKVTDNAETVPVSTTSGNTYATYVTQNDLDFSSVSSDITAYITLEADANATKIPTQAVTKVPANTAILVKTAEAGATVNVPVAATTPAALSANTMQHSASPVAGDGSTIFGFFKVSGQYGFAPVKTGTSLAAGKGYIVIPEGNSGSFLAIDFEEEATAVETVAEAKANTVAPVKVIKNGKLFIGNYNVAGQQVK